MRIRLEDIRAWAHWPCAGLWPYEGRRAVFKGDEWRCRPYYPPLLWPLFTFSPTQIQKVHSRIITWVCSRSTLHCGLWPAVQRKPFLGSWTLTIALSVSFNRNRPPFNQVTFSWPDLWTHFLMCPSRLALILLGILEWSAGCCVSSCIQWSRSKRGLWCHFYLKAFTPVVFNPRKP